MRADEFRFKVTDKKSGVSAVLSFDDLYGYEGLMFEKSGVLIRFDKEEIPEELRGQAINFNNGYECKGMNETIEIDSVD